MVASRDELGDWQPGDLSKTEMAVAAAAGTSIIHEGTVAVATRRTRPTRDDSGW